MINSDLKMKGSLMGTNCKGWVVSCLFLLMLSACGWLGGEKKQPPLLGERIDILQKFGRTEGDRELAHTKIIVPSPKNLVTWPQFHANASHNPDHLSFTGQPKELWQTNIGLGQDGRHFFLTGPVVANDTVFIANGNMFVSAIDLNTGRTRWRLNLKVYGETDEFTGVGLSVKEDGQILYVASPFGQIIALDAKNGKKLWATYLGAPIHSSPVLSNKKIFVTTMDGRLVALEENTGSILWFYKGSQENPTLVGSPAAAVAGDIVVVAFNSGEIFGLRAETGQLLWTDSISTSKFGGSIANLSSIRAGVIIDKELVLVINHNSLLVALDLIRGGRQWELQIGSDQTPWIAGDHLFVLTDRKELLAIQRGSGRVYWSKFLPDFLDKKQTKQDIQWFGPVIAQENLIITNSVGEILYLSPQDGHLISKQKINNGFVMAPIIVNNIMLLTIKNGTIIAFK